jgi:DNA helicase-2/ATP-dependent DNA helicase PcrA
LNPAQQEAVLHPRGPLLVLAGAGTGKTRTLTHRAAHLIASAKVRPDQILAITFTNKAAGEMRERLRDLVAATSAKMWVATFHAACARILRREAPHLGYPREFSIYDAEDQLTLARRCLEELDWDERRYPPAAMVAAVSRAKSELLDPDGAWETARDYQGERVAVFYRRYAERLRAASALDFDDLIFSTVRLFREQPRVLDAYRDRFRQVLVDEYQDTNHAQYVLVNLLTAEHRELFAVGDNDQSIYGWRNADIRNILEFQRDYPDARIIRLEQNYRSTHQILELANALIAHNAQRFPKALWTERSDGALSHLRVAQDERDEAAGVVRHITAGLKVGREPGSFAVIYRTHAQSRVFEEELMRAGITYQLIGGVRFYERREVKDILAYLRLLLNPADDLAAERVMNVPPRGIGPATLARLRTSGLPLVQACGLPAGREGLPARTAESLREFPRLLSTLRELVDVSPLAALVQRTIEDSGYAAWLRGQGSEEAAARLENLDELVSLAEGFAHDSDDPSLEAFLGLTALVADVDRLEGGTGGGVVLMTAHNAKGLEFPTVFVAGLEDGILPHVRSLDEQVKLEEERRLLYVGLTRAQDELRLSYARTRSRFGRPTAMVPSRFIAELPPQLLEREEATPSMVTVWEGTGRRGRAEPVAAQRPAEDFQVGDRIIHPRWGLGTVVTCREVEGDQELKLAFAGLGVKTVLAGYARLRRA